MIHIPKQTNSCRGLFVGHTTPPRGLGAAAPTRQQPAERLSGRGCIADRRQAEVRYLDMFLKKKRQDAMAVGRWQALPRRTPERAATTGT